MVCTMSHDMEGIKLVRITSQQVKDLTPQVVNAAKILAVRPQSKVAQENMDAFKEAWKRSVQLLTDSVDDILDIHEFLSVSENHILEDINRCVAALREKDSEILDTTAGAIRGRISRIYNMVINEIDKYETSESISRIIEVLSILKDRSITKYYYYYYKKK